VSQRPFCAKPFRRGVARHTRCRCDSRVSNARRVPCVRRCGDLGRREAGSQPARWFASVERIGRGTEEHRKDSGTSSRDLRKKAALAAAEAEASGELGEAQNKHLENLKQTDSDCTSRGYFKRTDSAVRLSIDMPMM